jgi:pimeloyl-ACP methyl ester carboxylesterase
MGAAFPDLSPLQWRGFARTIYRDEGGRPRLSYDARLRDAVEAAMQAAPADLWPLFDTLAAMPVLTIRGGNSDILSAETLAEMARRHPDMAHVTVANRGHAPFLDEPAAVAAIDEFLARHGA